MSNFAGKIRFNNSAWQTELQATPNATPIDSISNTRLGFLVKDNDNAQSISKGNTLKSLLTQMLMLVRDENLLEPIGVDYPDGMLIIANITDSKAQFVLQAMTADGFWFEETPDNTVVMLVPSAAGWAQQGSTVELNTLGERLYIAFEAQFIKQESPVPFPVP